MIELIQYYMIEIQQIQQNTFLSDKQNTIA